MLDVASRVSHPVFFSPEAEVRRLDKHFRRVLRALHRASPAGLGPAARRARARHVEELDRYRRAKNFPKNRALPGMMVPIFVDDEGTHCAMGHLIARSGDVDIVQHIRETLNYASIVQMGHVDQLLAWLEENGLSAEEAAMIQPAYCDAPATCICYDQTSTVVEGDIVSSDTSVMVTAVHGADQGVMVGDTIMLTMGGKAKVGDHVLVSYSPSSAWVNWVVPSSSELIVGQCNFYGVPPGPLPANVWIDAVLAGSTDACFAVLEKQSPGWTKFSGDGCNTSSSSSSSGGFSTVTNSGSGGTHGGGTFEGDTHGVDAGSCGVRPGEGAGSVIALALLAGLCAVHGFRRRVTR